MNFQTITYRVIINYCPCCSDFQQEVEVSVPDFVTPDDVKAMIESALERAGQPNAAVTEVTQI